MKRFRGILVRLVALLAGATLFSAALAETVTLTMATWTPPASAPFQSLRAWVDEVERASGGTLEIVFAETPLAPPPEQYDLVREGRADLAYVVPTYTPERFPMVAALEVPFMSPSAEVGSKALWEWYLEHVGEEELADVKLITLWATVPGLLHSTREVRTLEDLEGMHIRVPGGLVASIAEALGAVPVALPPGQVYEALQDGTIEAAFWDWNGVQDFNIAEVANYHLEIPDGLYTTPFVVVMNQESFESLSPEHQALLEDLGGASGAAFIGQIWDAMGDMGREAAIARDNVVETIDPSELERWRERLAFLDEAWIATANAQGYDGTALLNDFRSRIEAHVTDTSLR
jgi:TRAP-type transport system periplasmic protein